MKKAKGGTGTGNKAASTSVDRIDSSAPTALIAPEDYQHIFKGNTGQKKAICKATGGGNQLSYPSEAPTALIAPDDYEHIFKGDSGVKANTKKEKDNVAPKSVNKFSVPSNAPTALIAPSDYEHIFQEAETKGGASSKTANVTAASKSKVPTVTAAAATKDVKPKAKPEANSDLVRVKEEKKDKSPKRKEPNAEKDSMEGQWEQDKTESGACCCVLM